MQDEADVDRGWAWVVMFAAFGAQFIVGAMCYAAGVVHVALLQEFQQDVAFTSLVGSIFTSLISIIGPVVSYVINMYSCRVATMIGGILSLVGFSASFFVQNIYVLLITYGVITGIGMGFCVISAVIVVGYSFRKYYGIAVGFNVAGAGLGMFASGPLAHYFIHTYGIRGAFLMFGAVSAHGVLFGALMKPSEVEIRCKVRNKPRQQDVKNLDGELSTKCCGLNTVLFRNKSFLLILVCITLWNMPYSMVLLHLPNYAVIQGASTADAAFLLTMIGLGSTFNRVLTGFSIGPQGVDPLLLYVGFLGIVAVFTLTFPLYSTYYFGQVIFSLFFGIYSGGLITLLNPVAIDLVGVSHLSAAVGTMFLLGGVGYIIGPPIAGLIIDNGGTYEQGFYFSGVSFLLSSLASLLTSIWRQDSDTEKETVLKEIKETNFLSGSGYLSASLNVIFEIERNKGESREKLSTENLNGLASSDIIESKSEHLVKLTKQSGQHTNVPGKIRNGNQENIPLRCHDSTIEDV